MVPLTNSLKHAAACRSMPQRAKIFLGTVGAWTCPLRARSADPPRPPPPTRGAAVSVMSSGKPHQPHQSTCRPRPVVWWLGPGLLHHVSDGAPLPVCLRHRGTLWDLQWLPLPVGGRRYSTDCFA